MISLRNWEFKTTPITLRDRVLIQRLAVRGERGLQLEAIYEILQRRVVTEVTKVQLDELTMDDMVMLMQKLNTAIVTATKQELVVTDSQLKRIKHQLWSPGTKDPTP
jgi:hypothetical protein